MNRPVLSLAAAVLVSISGCSPPPDEADATPGLARARFLSEDGVVVTAVYSLPGRAPHRATVRLSLPDKTQVELHRATSGSGARYTNDAAEWWEHQGEATYVVDGTNVFRGKASSAD